ncbi:MAG: flippase-like domain-containing protein [Clostridia bacterium]|nr:flippase-like domain-containing protein [Clostridia bacterium]
MGKKKVAPKTVETTEKIAEELVEEQVDSVTDTTSETSEAAVESAQTEELNETVESADAPQKPDTEKTGADLKTTYNEEKEKEVEKITQRFEDKNRIDTKKKRRNWWIKTTLMLVLIGVSIYVMFTITSYLSDDGGRSFQAMIKQASLPFFFVFIGAVLVYMFIESMKYSYLLKISTGKFHLRSSMKTMYLGKYYDGITPLGTGGQPFQIYYLHKKDVPAGVATAVPLVKYITHTTVLCLTATAAFIYAGVTHMLGDIKIGDWGEPVILAVASVSMLLNLAIPGIMLFISLFPRMGKKLLLKIIKLLNKLHIVKRPYSVSKKYLREADEYRHALKLFFKKWPQQIPLLLLNFVGALINYSLPFFALLAIAGPSVVTQNPFLPFHILCLTFISYFSASLIPTPGNSGANEAMSTIVFSSLAAEFHPVLGWVLLLWRFGTYYIYIVTGIGLNIFDIIRGAVRQRRARKKEQQ